MQEAFGGQLACAFSNSQLLWSLGNELPTPATLPTGGTKNGLFQSA